ncbi:MAG: metalloregulator ArsR/SmtB family transcription factor [Thermodesulfovibrionales bacterium]
MDFTIDDNSTRRNIIQRLKKTGGMTIDELSRQINITPMGVRQHLLSLEKKGVVSYIARRQGIGRPGFIYMLTEAANDFFPNTYANFSLEMLRDINKHDGPRKIEQMFGWRRERMLNMYRNALAGREGIDDTLNGLKQLLESQGHFIELSRNNGHYHLKNYHCPINKIATEFKEACKHELQMFQDLLGKNVTREHTVSDGSICCLYVIPATNN